MSEELELIDAAKRGEADRARSLLDRGANVHQGDEQGWTPLSWAAGQGHTEVIRVLLDHGADVTRTGRDLRTPLMIARAAGKSDATAILAEAERELGAWEDPRETRPYCKAHYLRDLRRFPGWSEGKEDEAGAPLEDDSIVYLHQDLTVTRSMWTGEEVVFDDVTPEWRSFCEGELGFEIPDDLL